MKRKYLAPHGLTLVEVVLVMALLVVMAGAVAFNVGASANAARLRAGADWTASVVRQAVRLSWTQYRPVRVQFQPGTMNVSVIVWNGSAWAPAVDFFQQWLPGNDRPQGVVVASTSYPANTLTITPTGLGVWSVESSAYATEGEIVVSYAGVSLRVFTTRDGKVFTGR